MSNHRRITRRKPADPLPPVETEVYATCPGCHAEIALTLRYDFRGYDESGVVYEPAKLVAHDLGDPKDDGCYCGHSEERLIQIAEDQLQADAEAADERRYDGR